MVQLLCALLIVGLVAWTVHGSTPASLAVEGRTMVTTHQKIPRMLFGGAPANQYDRIRHVLELNIKRTMPSVGRRDVVWLNL